MIKIFLRKLATALFTYIGIMLLFYLFVVGIHLAVSSFLDWLKQHEWIVNVLFSLWIVLVSLSVVSFLVYVWEEAKKEYRKKYR